jgi:hypothetical protein
MVGGLLVLLAQQALRAMGAIILMVLGVAPVEPFRQTVQLVVVAGEETALVPTTAQEEVVLG